MKSATEIIVAPKNHNLGMRIAGVLSITDVHSWSDYALNLANSAANIIGIIAAAVVLIAIALIYFTGSELTERAKGKLVTSQQDQTKALRQSQAELSAAWKSEKATSLRLSQIETELTAAKHSQESMASRLSKTQTELAAARRATDEKTLLLSQAEAELAAARKSGKEKTLRLSQVEAELAIARRSGEEAERLAKQLEQKPGPRKITSEQRTEFLKAIRGMPTGKVIVSAFFDNKETHEFGTQILSLLKEDGFEVIQRAPLNFFTTSRPASGVRIGCENISDPPPHFTTVRQGLKAIGLDAPTTTLINAREKDMVEIQVTPRH